MLFVQVLLDCETPTLRCYESRRAGFWHTHLMLLCNIRRTRCYMDSDEFVAKFIPSRPSIHCLQVDEVGRGVPESTTLRSSS